MKPSSATHPDTTEQTNASCIYALRHTDSRSSHSDPKQVPYRETTTKVVEEFFESSGFPGMAS